MTLALLILVLPPSLFLACMFWLRARPEPKRFTGTSNRRVNGYDFRALANLTRTGHDCKSSEFPANFRFMPMPEPGRFRFRKGRVWRNDQAEP